MILNMEDLRKYDFQLSKINVIHQKPRYRRLVVNKRTANGFLMILHGNCRYLFQGGYFQLDPGSVVYLPVGSSHVLEVDSEAIEFYRIDFQLKVDGEIARFSNVPKKMCHTAPKECAEAVRALMDNCQFVQDSVRKAELMCTIFRTLAASLENSQKERLAPAIAYLLEHLTGEIDCGCLAQLCSLGSSQFYSLFQAEYKMTPLAYRDSLLIQKAAILLQDGMFSVTEVAEMLGFESVSYFSRLFKKRKGVSPSKFQHLSEKDEEIKLD